MFNFLMPKSPPFFAMLAEQNSLLLQMIDLLVENLQSNPQSREGIHKRNINLEIDGDAAYFKVIRNLSRAFITPIDREDILRIAQKQEELMDCLHGLSIRIHIFEFQRIRFPALQLAQTVSKMLHITAEMLDCLSQKKDSHKTHAFRALRDESDSIIAIGLAEWMDCKGEIDSNEMLTILKWNQIYERLSLVVESAAGLGETIEEAVLKNV